MLVDLEGHGREDLFEGVDLSRTVGWFTTQFPVALEIPGGIRSTLAAHWLLLGMFALIASGLLSILLVFSRTPGTQNLLPSADFFHVALVAHVDLSVLVWFLAMAGMVWTLNSTSRAIGIGRVGFGLAALGTAAIALSPFLGRGRPVMANYIPVLRDPWFLSGLMMFAGGVAVLVVRGMATASRVAPRLRGGDSAPLARP